MAWGQPPTAGGWPFVERMNRRRLINVIAGLVFATGLVVLLYPLVSDAWNSWRQARLVSEYDERVAATSATDNGAAENDAWFAKADAYNAALSGKGIPDAFAVHSEEGSADYLSQLAFRSDGMMGYIQIPKIGQSLPIYHGTSEESLARGVGHLQGSALPVGGESTHCVLSAHRGLPSASLFTDLDKLQEGDHFYLHVLDRTLAYEVDQILVVDPDQTESLEAVEGQDLVTLVTCTPYGVNTQRLLVRGHRVSYDEGVENAELAAGPAWSIFTQYWLWVAGGLLLVALFVLWCWRRSRREGEAGPGRAGNPSAARGPRHVEEPDTPAAACGPRHAGGPGASPDAADAVPCGEPVPRHVPRHARRGDEGSEWHG